jgi:hypothetical protein
MKASKKEEYIKEVNIKELKANFRTIYLVSVMAFTILGFIGGYFASINIITDSQSKALHVYDTALLKAK